MAEAHCEVLYRKGQSDDSDLWDDTALITAYDEAISTMKSQLITNGVPNHPKDELKKKKKKPRKKSKKESEPTVKWKVGDHCQAVYTQDGELYHALIQSIDENSQTCIVRFLGYGNEETQQLKDLLESSESQYNHDSHDVMSQCSTSTPISINHSQRSQTRRHRDFMNGHETSMPFPIPLMGSMPSFPFAPPPPFAVPTGFMPNSVPHIPPPPPMIDDDDVSSDSSALHSMLISWYMSGYHTGYYQGLKAGKKSSK